LYLAQNCTTDLRTFSESLAVNFIYFGGGL
jgi:hypothetical protein